MVNGPSIFAMFALVLSTFQYFFNTMVIDKCCKRPIMSDVQHFVNDFFLPLQGRFIFIRWHGH